MDSSRKQSNTQFPELNVNNGSLIKMVDVDKTYHTAAGHFTALKDVNLNIGEGEFVSIIGKSGSGKTTLINVLTGIDNPTRGEIYVSGTPIHSLNEGQKQDVKDDGRLVVAGGAPRGYDPLSAVWAQTLSQ